MRCLLCQKLSYPVICTKCRHTFLKPHQTTRILTNGFKVYSFYKYSEIAFLLKTKHTHIGAAVYRILAQHAFRAFAREFCFETFLDVVPVDDIPKSGYSHTAILAKYLGTRYMKPYYHALRAQNDIHYSAKSLKFRQENPRDFIYPKKRYENVIIVDDIVTTGTTILEAKKVIEKSGAKPIFALTLADASDL